jgi:hypothetical protein
MLRYSAFSLLCFMPDCVDESYIPHSLAFIESFASCLLIHVLKSSTRNLFPLYHKVFNPLRRKWLPFTCCISNLIKFLCSYALVSSTEWRLSVLVVASSYKWSSTASLLFCSLNTSNWSWAIDANASNQSPHLRQFELEFQSSVILFFWKGGSTAFGDARSHIYYKKYYYKVSSSIKWIHQLKPYIPCHSWADHKFDVSFVEWGSLPFISTF